MEVNANDEGKKKLLTPRGIIFIIAFLVIGGIATGVVVWQVKSTDKSRQQSWESMREMDKKLAEEARKMMPTAKELIRLRKQIVNLSPGTPEYENTQKAIDRASSEIASQYPLMVTRCDDEGNPIIANDKELMEHLNILMSGDHK